MQYPARFQSVVIGLVLAGACVSRADSAENLLLNPGAEQGASGMPSVWGKASVEAPGLRMLQETGQAHAGQASLAIANTHVYEHPVANNWAQRLQEVPRGKVLHLSVWLRTRQAEAANVCVQCWDATMKNMLAFSSTPIVRGDQDWVQLQADPLVVPDKTESVIVRAALSGKGEVWFDDFVLTAEQPRTAATSPMSTSRPADTATPEGLARLLPGPLVRELPIKRDCMVLAYLPKWGMETIDNIAMANNDGGVRTLAAWPEVPAEETSRADRRFLVAYYARTVTCRPPTGRLQFHEILNDWPEKLCWDRQPLAAARAAGDCEFVDGKGWKLFDVTALVKSQAKAGRRSHGIIIRFSREDARVSGAGYCSYNFASAEATGEWQAFRPRLLIVSAPSSSAPSSEPAAAGSAPEQVAADSFAVSQRKPVRGLAILASSVGRDYPAQEILDFVSGSQINLVIIDFAWITAHWNRTDFDALRDVAQRLQSAGVRVAAMYRPRALRPEDAPLHYAQDTNGNIASHHLDLCFAQPDSVNWGCSWGEKILAALPSVDHIILYNLRSGCECEKCRDGKARQQTARFIAECRRRWTAKRANVTIGHVGLDAEFAAQVDALYPFLPVMRGQSALAATSNRIGDVLLATESTGKLAALLLKTCWDEKTNPTDDEVVNAIESCCRRGNGWVLWYYEHLFRQPQVYNSQRFKSAISRGQADANDMLLRMPPPVAETRGAPALAPPPELTSFERLPWPHQAPGLGAEEIARLGRDIWVINNFPLYQGGAGGRGEYLHGGLDIVLENGTRIYAMQDGWVKAITGSTVSIADPCCGMPSWGWEYTHLGQIQVKPGEFVKRGACIGQIEFKGLPHLHLTRVFSEGAYWGRWRSVCVPNRYFSFTDNQPPVIQTPFYFFPNDSDAQLKPDASGVVSLRGGVDIVVGMRDAGQYAHSAANGFGDRLAVARIEYEIHRTDAVAGQPRRSFDFTRLAIPESFTDLDFNTTITRVVYKPHALLESQPRNGNQSLSYYIITNHPAVEAPRTLTPALAGHCWDTTAKDAAGNSLFPDGLYEITVRAWDFNDNVNTASMRAHVRNNASQPGNE